jgi:hypothetical protein
MAATGAGPRAPTFAFAESLLSSYVHDEGALALARTNPKEYVERFRLLNNMEKQKYFSLLSAEGFQTHLDATLSVALASAWRRPQGMEGTAGWSPSGTVDLWGLSLSYLDGSTLRSLWLVEGTELSEAAFDTLLAWSRRQLASHKLAGPSFRLVTGRTRYDGVTANVAQRFEQVLRHFGPVKVTSLRLVTWPDTYDRGGLEDPAGGSCRVQLRAEDGTQFDVELGTVPQTEVPGPEGLEAWARATAEEQGVALDVQRQGTG